MPRVRLVPTSHGDARLTTHAASRPAAVVVLTHGAGGGIDAPDLVELAASLPAQGVSVTLLEMPWRVAGRRVAPRPAVLDECFLDVLTRLRPRVPLVVGGRSAGARSACRVSTSSPRQVAGALALSFPLHPPGRPERSRLPELEGVGVPVLVVQGERDTFGRPEEFPERHDLAVVPAVGHDMRAPRRGPVGQADAMAVVREATLDWLVREVVGNP